MTALTSVTTVRAGVEALRSDRLRAQHAEGSIFAERQAAEVVALDAVLRLIDTGHWLTATQRERMALVDPGQPAGVDGARFEGVGPDGKISLETAVALGLVPEPEDAGDLDARTAQALLDVREARAAVEARLAVDIPPTTETVIVPLDRLVAFDPIDREHTVETYTRTVAPGGVHIVRTDPDESTPIAEGVYGHRTVDRQYDRTCDACVRGDGVVRHTCEDAPRLHGGGR